MNGGAVLKDVRYVVDKFARFWWIFLITGIGWLVVAWLVLRLNETSLKTVGILLGIVFVVAAVNEGGMIALVSGGWKVWHGLLAIIFLLGGLWAFIRPVDSFFALASVLGFVLIFYGAFEIVRAFSMQGLTPYWWVSLITGVLLILLAFWVSGSDRVYALARRTYLILFFVSFWALFRGFSQISIAFTIRHLWRSGQTKAPQGSQA
jgi:uncharacterized membrane protein HdeD (DUF308 family)